MIYCTIYILLLNDVPSAGTDADKQFVADVYSICQRSRKPLLVAVNLL
jgi:hypothetical protein